MIIIAKANNASYVTISESPVRMKEIHRHHSFHSSLMKGAKKYCSFHLKEKGATATVVVFLRVLPFGETFSILRHVSGFVKEKRKNGEGTRATDGRPYHRESNVFAVGISSPRFLRSRAMTACARYGKLLSLIGDTVCLPEVFSPARKYLCFYICDSYKKSSKRFWKEGAGENLFLKKVLSRKKYSSVPRHASVRATRRRAVQRFCSGSMSKRTPSARTGPCAT